MPIFIIQINALMWANKNGHSAIKNTFNQFLKMKNAIMIVKGKCHEQIISFIKEDDDNLLQKEKLVINSLKDLWDAIKTINKESSNCQFFFKKKLLIV